MVAASTPRVGTDLEALAVDLHPATRDTHLVVACLVGGAPPADGRDVALAHVRRTESNPVQIEGQTGLVRLEGDPDVAVRLDHIVAQRTDRRVPELAPLARDA